MPEERGSYLLRVIKSKDYKMVNICDEEVCGTRLKEGELEINISEDFYSGEKIDEGELLNLLKSAQIINLTGNRCVRFAVENGFAHKDAVKKVKSVSFLMIFKFIR
ncbi:MAG: DUF424 family protein [Nitrososphaeria archaeon]